MKGAIAAASLAALAVLALAGCSSATPSHPAASTPRPAATAPAPAPSPSATADLPGSDVLSCSTVVDDTGWNNGPLTAQRMIADLIAMDITDGLVNLPSGTPSHDDVQMLDDAGQVLMNYGTGNQLGLDAAQFVSDEQAYSPDGPVDASHGKPLLDDILALQKDCPGAASQATSMLKGGK